MYPAKKQNESIVITGNGFDLAHGYPTRYEDFINWYWEKRVHSFHGNLTPLSEDCLCSIKMTSDNSFNCWNVFAFHLPRFCNELSVKDIFQGIQSQPEQFEIRMPPFFRSICESIETKGWVDIEREYYSHVKMCMDSLSSSNNSSLPIKVLNYQLEYLRQLLVEYLKSLQYINWEK